MNEINAVRSLTVADGYIRSVKGLEFFNKLQFMEITADLETLDCSANSLLEELDCGCCCTISSLNVSGCRNLRRLNCETNALKELDVSGCTMLETLYCDNNLLSDLNVNDCPSMRNLTCTYNNLSVLDISGCPSVIDVYQNGESEETPGVEYYDGEDIPPSITYSSYSAADPDGSDEYKQEFSVDAGVSIVV